MRLQKSDSESGVDSRPFHFFSFDSDSALGLEELNPTPIPGGKWWSGVDSGFGVDSTGINYKSDQKPIQSSPIRLVRTVHIFVNSVKL